MTDFIHSETSNYAANKVASGVWLKPSGLADVKYPSFSSGAGKNVWVHHNIMDWRVVPGAANSPTSITVRGNVDYPITGYSVVGTIYIYSNEMFVTVTPTPTATATATPMATSTLAPTATTQVRWYTGNDRPNAYGIKANIWTPEQPLYIAGAIPSGQSNWVSTPAPYWAQVGWRYYPGYVAPRRYYESSTPSGINTAVEIGNHDWGGIVEYKVVSTGGTIWCMWIGGVEIECVDTSTQAPRTVFAHSEVHISSQNELNTRFSAVYYLDTNYAWQLFDQALWRENPPYSVQKDQYYNFRNYGP